MKKTLLNEVNRFKKLAGLLKEDDYTEDPNLIPSGDTDAMSIAEDEEDSEGSLPVDASMVSTDDSDNIDNIGDEKEMSPADRAVLTKGLQLMTKPQMAALYLTALEKYEGARGKYLVMVPGLEPWGQRDESDAFRVSIVRLQEALGLDSYQTAIRTIRKFKNILSGVGGTEDEVIYPKIIKAAEEFEKMNPRDVAMLAGDAITGEPTVAASRSLRKPAEDPKKLAQRVDFLVKGLMKNPLFKDRAKAEKVAISKIAKEKNTDEFKVAKAYQSFIKIKESEDEA